MEQVRVNGEGGPLDGERWKVNLRERKKQRPEEKKKMEGVMAETEEDKRKGR